MLFKVFSTFVKLVVRQTTREHRLLGLATFLLALMAVALSSAAPLFLKRIVDALQANPGSTQSLVILLAIYIATFAMGRLCGSLQWYAYGGFEQRFQRLLMLHLFDKVHNVPFRIHQTRRAGEVQQIISNGLLGARLIFFHFLMIVFPFLLTLIIMSSVIGVLYPLQFLAVFLIATGLYVASLVVGVEYQRKSERHGTDAYIDAFAKVADSLRNFETIKLFDGEKLVRERLDSALRRGEAEFTKFYKARAGTNLAQALWLTTGLGLIVALATLRVANEELTMGDLALFVSYVLLLWGPLDMLALAYRETRIGLTHIERMLTLIGQDAASNDLAEALLPPGPGELSFTNVSFHYDKQRPLLKDVTFDVRAGETVAIVGASGAGKSTLARIAFRFLDAQSGDVAVDGVSISKVGPRSLRSAIAIVPQDTMLLADTLEFNLRIARPDCSAKEMEEAANLAQIHDLIASLPKGYQTVVGEHGLALSGGERQRLGIARAILKKPRVFIFDEATSALDTKLEEAIQSNLANARRRVTKIYITHRLSTALRANEIIVLHEGAIAERGDHQSLLAQGGLYSELWRKQGEGVGGPQV